MDNYPIEKQTPTDSRRSLHVMNKTSHSDKLHCDHSGSRYKSWLGVVAIALLLSVIALIVSSKGTKVPLEVCRERTVGGLRAILL